VKYFFIILGISFWNVLNAAPLKPQGHFLKDSIKIGEEVAYAFSFRYPSDMTVLFPDTTYNFFPFELDRKVFFPTVTDSIYNIDSVLYYLETFEIDSVQYLRLPVFIITDGDSSVIFSAPDSIILVEVVKEIPKEPKLKEDTGLVPVKKAVNYPLILLVLVIVLTVIGLIAIFYGKSLYRAWKVFRLQRAHKKFVSRFFGMIRDVSSNNPSVKVEHVLAVWKQYMEKLERKPFAKMTTTEITRSYPDPELKEHLRNIDRTIYGNEKSGVLFKAFDYLLKYANERYHKRIEEIRNG
jgi:hypothetical protein